MINPPCPEPRRADQQGESAAGEADEETSWLLAAALIDAKRQSDGRPRDELMRLLAEMTVDRGPETVALAALGLADVAAALLEVCADSLKEAPQAVLRDVLDILREDDGEGAVSRAASG